MFSFSNALVPFALPLGWGLGYVVTTGMRKMFDYFNGTDSNLHGSNLDNEQTDPAGNVFCVGEFVEVPNDETTPAGVALSSSESSAPDGVALSEDENKFVGDSFTNAPRGLTDPDGEVNLSEHRVRSDTYNVTRTEAPQGNTEDNPLENFCKFSNGLKNSWVNAAFQSILNLSETRRCLAQKRVFIEASPIPSCATLILSAVRNPGKHVSPEEIAPVLKELRERKLGKGGDSEITSLVESVLVWLDTFGGRTDTELYSEGSCPTCHTDCLELLSNGPVIHLPTPQSEDNIAALFNRWVNLGLKSICSGCGTKLIYKDCLTNNNVLVFYVPPSARSNHLKKVTPNPSILVPGERGAEMYNLNSVICCGSDRTQYYTYITHGPQTVKVIDEHVFTADSRCSEDMNRRGFLYVYEKERKKSSTS